jgi:hypothetical protein
MGNQVCFGVENPVNLGGGTIATSCKVVIFNTPCRRDVCITGRLVVRANLIGDTDFYKISDTELRSLLLD